MTTYRDANQTINQLLEDAIGRWQTIAGIDMTQTSGKVKNWDLGQFTRDLLNTQALDNSGLTAFMLLRGYFEWFLKQAQFNAYDLILDPGSVRDQLTPLNALRDILEAPEVVALINQFTDHTLAGCLHYGADQEDIKAWLDSKYSIALIRRDALRSLETLEAHQFTQGKGSPNPPKYNPKVWQFWNINSAIQSARFQEEPGISVCLMRDPAHVFASFFLFVYSNGETVTVLTDRPKNPHPAYNKMTRRPDRDLERREIAHRFPYQLLNVAYDPNEERLFEIAEHSLVRTSISGVPMCDIIELNPDQLIWIMFMFDLIRDRYYLQDHKLPELSFTGEMVRRPESLVSQQSALARADSYHFLELPRVTGEDLTPATLEAQWQRAPTYQNQWMLDRYGSQVPEDALDLVGKSEQLAIPWPETKYLLHRTEGHHEGTEYLAPEAFGSESKLTKDRLWAGRVNQMRWIQRLAEKEFEDTKKEVIDWCKAKIEGHPIHRVNAGSAQEILIGRRV